MPDRKSATFEEWLRDHPGVEIVVRDGSTTDAEAVRRVLPEAIQASDRWHLWHGLAGAVEKAVAAHSRCWAAAGPKRQALTRENTTLERWRAVHDLLEHGVGLLDCSRRLGLALNMVKRYARAPERLRRPPQYRASLVDSYRDHRQQRRVDEPGVSVARLFTEITDLGYTGSLNLLHKYLNQGREQRDRIMPSPRRLASWILTKPADLPEQRRTHLHELLAACPEMTALARLVGEFAQLMAERHGRDLDQWIAQARQAGISELDPFLRGLNQDHQARGRRAVTALQQRPHRRRQHQDQTTETSNLREASFTLLRKRILLTQ
ncbi:transposase [Saccharopolyspora sp. 5N708]|uniref:transposase n=1 Tax=Saccharopolyspora sp. 5N708 TaxID=3457424 RepID=UPI003FCF9251